MSPAKKEIDLSEFRVKTIQPCVVGRLINDLSSDEIETVNAASAAHDISCAAIVNWLGKHAGSKPSISSVLKHRNGSCRCNG